MALETFDINGFFAMISAILLLIITWYNKQRTEAATITADAVQATARTNAIMATQAPVSVSTIPPFDPGFTVYPAYAEIKSGDIVGLNIKTGVQTKSIEIDWKDGNTTTKPITSELNIAHQYFFYADDHYTGHQYYPKFTIYDAFGQSKTFNDIEGGQGSCCAVLVSSK